MNEEVRIAEVGAKGQGVGFDGAGNVYFVPGALPGDVVRVEVEQGARRYRDAQLLEILTPSSSRRPSPCEYSRECGGCDWLDWEYKAQLEAKHRGLAHALERAGLPTDVIAPVIAAASETGYRHRVQLRRQEGALGFFRKASNDLVDIERCVVAHPAVNEKITQIRREMGSGPDFEKVEIVADEKGEVSVAFDAPHAALGFTQVNEEQNVKLKEVVSSAISRVGAERVLELYCGNGNLTVAYLPLVKEALAYDASQLALAYARQRAAAEAPVRFRQSEIDASLPARLPESFRGAYDTLLLDPPRRGAGKALVEFLHGQLKNIIYVSCSPVTFSQEARPLIARGFRLETVVPLDMFPQTHHLELVACFSRA